MKRTKQRRNKLIIIGLLILISLTGVVVLLKRSNSDYVYLRGRVTSYNEEPTLYDGPITFAIDGQPVDIGGGLRNPSSEFGEVYSPIKINDRVEAKAKKVEGNWLTVYNCGECYVRKN